MSSIWAQDPEMHVIGPALRASVNPSHWPATYVSRRIRHFQRPQSRPVELSGRASTQRLNPPKDDHRCCDVAGRSRQRPSDVQEPGAGSPERGMQQQGRSAARLNWCMAWPLPENLRCTSPPGTTSAAFSSSPAISSKMVFFSTLPWEKCCRAAPCHVSLCHPRLLRAHPHVPSLRGPLTAAAAIQRHPFQRKTVAWCDLLKAEVRFCRGGPQATHDARVQPPPWASRRPHTNPAGCKQPGLQCPDRQRIADQNRDESLLQADAAPCKNTLALCC